MNRQDNELDQRLEALGRWLRAKPSITKDDQTLAGLKPIPVQATSTPFWRRPGVGMAACILIGISLWFSLTGPVPLTYAEVQKSLNNKPWVLIRYDSGAQEWVNLVEHRTFFTRRDADGGNFYVSMRDFVNGLWRAYHSNWGQQIHEEPFKPDTYPQTPWEYAVDGWDSLGPSRSEYSSIERNHEVINERQVIRFDTYDLGPLDLRVLAQTVWADPETRLPIRIRKYSDPERYKEPDTGDFSFPEIGPASIYDLNAPQGLPVVTNADVIEPAAQKLIDTAKERQRQTPLQMEIVDSHEFWVTIYFRWYDKSRSESYGHVNENQNNSIPLDIPEGVQDVRTWARQNLTLLKVGVFDGTYEYTYHTADERSVSKETNQSVLHIHRRNADWINVLVPLYDQWPYVGHVGPMRALVDEPGLPAGCVLLQYDETSHQPCDWIIDTQRDNICLKQLRYRKSDHRSDARKQELLEDVERSDLVQLPSGQWYAKTIQLPGRSSSITKREVTILTGDEMQAIADGSIEDFFNGEKLITLAKAEGAKITFWAR